MLLGAGASVDLLDRHNVSPLWVACAVQSRDVAALLLEAHADANGHGGAGCPPLSLAAQHGDGEMLALLLGAGAVADAADGQGNTPLLLASHHGHSQCVLFLLQAKRVLGQNVLAPRLCPYKM